MTGLDRRGQELRPTRVRQAALGVAGKITEDQLRRLAVVYVRQSSPRQVAENRESTEVQYNLKERAAQLGWDTERVLVIDEDQGRTGSTAVHRVGFQRLLAEIGLNHVGLVLGWDMSRLARSCKDWYQLIELCAVFNCVLADQDGLYDPSDYNDRLLLGLKGTMSEAELHILRSRMEQGRRNKAARGELYNQMPIGYILQEDGQVTLDPDRRVQDTIRLVFDLFERLGSGRGVLCHLREHRIPLPFRPHYGPTRGQLRWRPATPATLYGILHHPQYAGAYAYGRRQIDPRRRRPGLPGTGRVSMPIERWHVLLRDRLPAYIEWDQYEANQLRLRNNAPLPTTRGATREGQALLGGLVMCSRCGRRMYIQYGDKPHRPRYMCNYDHKVMDGTKRYSFAARAVDELVCAQVLCAVRPTALELSLRASEDLCRDRERQSRQWEQELERARYQAQLARRRYEAVDPDNRLVAAELERGWDEALRRQRGVEEEYDRFKAGQPSELSSSDRELIRSLATNLPALWEAPTTRPQDRQEIIRLLIEKIVVGISDVTEKTDVTIRWIGGGNSHHVVVRPVGCYAQMEGHGDLLARIVDLRDRGLRAREIAEQLNRDGYRTPRKVEAFRRSDIETLVRSRGIARKRGEDTQGRHNDMRENEWELEALADHLGVPPISLRHWCRKGWVVATKKGLGNRRWVIRADATELERLSRLKGYPRPRGKAYPRELVTPPLRSPQGRSNASTD
jgi:DNA invertase Pin-like site-specific DNA recombinase